MNILRVLMVEDEETDAKLVLRALQRADRVVEHLRVQDAPAMRAALAGEGWDVILSDWSMPRFDALGALGVLIESELDIPFIIVSGTIGEELAIDAMRAGAHDYVLKDRLSRLSPAVEREVRDAEIRRARRRAEESLRIQETRFRALIEKSHDGISLSSRDGVTIYASPAAKRIFGTEDLVEAPAFEMVHPDDRVLLEASIARIIREPSLSATFEYRIVRADGAVRWLEAVYTNLLDEPVIGAVVANFRDITERKDSAAALRESEVRFDRLADSGIIGIVIVDVVAGTTLAVNDAALTILGYDRQEVLSGEVTWLGMTPPGWQEQDLRATEQLKAYGKTTPWEKELFHKNGRRVPVLIGAAMMDQTRCISFVVDLSERKRVELALHESEDQLRHAQKMEAVGRLAGGVAHDFNNLLSVILSYSELLGDDFAEGDPVRLDLEQITKAAMRAATLTRQLLLFSRQQVVQPKILNLNDTLGQLDKMLRRLVGEDVQITLHMAADIGNVKIDPGHVEQVVMNLVVNSRDAMPTGGKLTIETENVVVDDTFAGTHFGVTPGDFVMLAVSDTGTGMDKATQTRIFEPFFTTKEIGKGTGLGLSTVFGIVQQSGGSVWVYSEPGLGTTFKVYLPRVDAHPVEVARAATPLAKHGSETILVVEDEEQVRMVACSILRRHGYSVIEALNPGDAVLLCESHPGTIELLLTDVVMPHMSGPQLAKRISGLYPHMKVLCMSGYTDHSIVEHGVLESKVPFIQKPFTPDSLATRVREVLDGAA